MHSRPQQQFRPARKVEKSRRRRFRPAVEALEQRLTPTGSPFVEPPVIASDPATHILTATLFEQVATSANPVMVGDTAVINAWTYNGSYVGPTLRANPGDLLDITTVNQLGEPTNLHTHGLHVS